VTPAPPDDGETFIPIHAKLHEISCELSDSFWSDKKIEKLFNSSDVERLLISWIKV